MAKQKRKLNAMKLAKSLDEQFEKLSKGTADINDSEGMRKTALALVKIVRDVKSEQEKKGQSISKEIKEFLNLK